MTVEKLIKECIADFDDRVAKEYLINVLTNPVNANLTPKQIFKAEHEAMISVKRTVDKRLGRS